MRRHYKRELHVHHKHYSETGNPWDIGNWALITLCNICHEHEESLKNLVRTDLTNHQQLIVNSNIELLNDLYYIGNQKQLFDDLIEFFKSKDTKGLIDYE